jgi:DNA polymerase IV
MTRKIIHCDADCFFAAIEMRDDPSLRGRPMAVGGSADRRGVISTCNYEARRFGVHSAMASATAKRLCPELIIVPHRMEQYKEASQQIRDIFLDYTDLFEPLSLDEGFLDVSNSSHCKGSATLIAKEIRQRVFETLKITISAGIAPNKFLAKIASDWQKPDALFVISPEKVEAFVKQLPVSKIFGVGKVTTEKMRRLGIDTCADLRPYTVYQLVEHFGSFGPRLYDLCRGIDDRPVKPSGLRKSLSVEHTYSSDITSVQQCLSKLPTLIEQLMQRLNRLDSNDYQVTKAFVKIKFDNFSTTTLERMGTKARISDFKSMMEEAIDRGSRPVRLLGIGVRFMEKQDPHEAVQLELFEKNIPTILEKDKPTKIIR